MTATIIGFLVGMTLGAGSGSAGIAMLGGALGLLAGFTVHAAAWLWAHSGDAPTVEHHRLYCSSYGGAADCELVGDLERRRWLDVKSCSLLGEAVTCDKQCLRLVNDAGVRPGQACTCQGIATLVPPTRPGRPPASQPS